MPSMVQSLTRLRSQEKARFDPERAPSEPRHIRHARAWGRCLDRVGAAVHRVTGIRLDSLRAWARPHDGDRESPTEKASRAMWAAIDSGMEWNDATAPLAELAADFGCSLQRLDIDEAPPVLAAASNALLEVSDVVREISSAIADGRATLEERLRMKQETRELVVSLARLEMALEAESLNNSAGPGAANSPGLQKGSGR